MEQRICKNCDNKFEIIDDDQTFYTRLQVPPPTLCSQCRAQRRLAFRNERAFYKRLCDKCKQSVVSMYSPGKSYTVYCHDCWFADDWEALSYGRDYDLDKPFFEQFGELWNAVPKISLMHTRSVNSEYLNICDDSKDCYMIVESSNNENCIHCYWIQECKDNIDVSFASKTELSYECDDCYNSYKLQYCKGCHNCRESFFLLDCRDCSDCIGCVNLRSKKYCVFNEQKTKEEYEQFLKNARLDTQEGVETLREKAREFFMTQPRKYAEIVNAINSTGNYIKNAKNCQACFHCYDAEDNKYCVHVWREAKDCMDVDTAGRTASMIYNSINAGMKVSNYICCAVCWECSFMQYSYYCFNSQNCFGCVGLRKKQYCILNKQYSKEDYEQLTKKIIASLGGEYGEFFPPSLSCFGYNETAAQEQFPLTREQALAQGFKWEDTERGTYGKENGKDIFACERCKKNYLIIPREFEFYQRLSIPLPTLCPDCRHARRFTARGPNRLWKRNCVKCSAEFETNYAPGRPEILYCEKCYNAEVN